MLKNRYSHNSDDVFIRTLYASLSETLTETVSYIQLENNNKKTIKKVKFVLSATGQERFLYYYFSGKNYETCEELVEGSFDEVPRGIYTLKDNNIQTSELTSPYTYIDIFLEDDNGAIKKYKANIVGIPLKFTVSIDIMTNTANEQQKIWQSIIEELIFTKKFRFIYKGVVIESMISFSENLNNEKLFEFQTGKQSENIKMTLSLDIESYYPKIIKKYGADNLIKEFKTTVESGTGIEIYNTLYDGKMSGRIYDENLEPVSETIKLIDNTGTIIQSCVLEDGYFLFTKIPSKSGYILKTSGDIILQKNITIYPDENKSFDIYYSEL